MIKVIADDSAPFRALYTHYPTQPRIVKDSGRSLADVAATNGAKLADEG